jgi:hypothetical protein
MRRPRGALSRAHSQAASPVPSGGAPPPPPPSTTGVGPAGRHGDGHGSPTAAGAPTGRGRSPWTGRLLVAGALLAIAITGLWLRLRHNGYGLPFVYNYDEATHFTNRAVTMFSDDFDPGYYQNPSGYTYLS